MSNTDLYTNHEFSIFTRNFPFNRKSAGLKKRIVFVDRSNRSRLLVTELWKLFVVYLVARPMRSSRLVVYLFVGGNSMVLSCLNLGVIHRSRERVFRFYFCAMNLCQWYFCVFVKTADNHVATLRARFQKIVNRRVRDQLMFIWLKFDFVLACLNSSLMRSDELFCVIRFKYLPTFITV